MYFASINSLLLKQNKLSIQAILLNKCHRIKTKTIIFIDIFRQPANTVHVEIIFEVFHFSFYVINN